MTNLMIMIEQDTQRMKAIFVGRIISFKYILYVEKN